MLCTGSNCVPCTAPERPPKRDPAHPAMNPESAKATIFARRTLSPSVPAASSLSRIAVSWRPNQLRRTDTDDHGEEHEHHSAPGGEGGIGAGGEAEHLGPADREAVKSEHAGIGQDHLAADEREAEGAEREVQAAQAHRRQRHDDSEQRRRRAHRGASRGGCRRRSTCPATNAPTPTNRNWARDSWPERPVRATTDREMVANTSARTTLAWRSPATRWPTTATAAMRPAPATSDRYNEGTAGSSRPTDPPGR